MDRTTTLGWLIAGALLAGMALGVPGCFRDRPLVVASKNFTEQVLVGEIVAQHLEHRLGLKVKRRLNLGGTFLAHQALVNGQIDLYPEYTGTALTAILKQPPATDPASVLVTLRAEYHARFDAEWLDPLGFNNSFAMVVRGADARAHRMTSLSDAARARRDWILGMGYEFQQRPDGLAGLLRTYRLSLKGPVKTMDLGLLYQALEQRQVDMIAANATDGLLAVRDVTVLQDDQGYFPPYQPALVVRADALKADPRLKGALNELAGKFSDATMRRLNYLVDGEHRPVREVAATFLHESGLRQ